MKYFIFTLFLILTTFALRTGDLFGVIISMCGFLIMMHVCDSYEKTEL